MRALICAFSLLWILNAKASPCDARLAPTSAVFYGQIEVESGHSLFVRVERPSNPIPKGWFFLVHGLLDTHATFDLVTQNLLREGYGVVRMDLYGFGQSLPAEWTSVDHDYRNNVADLRSLVKIVEDRFGVESPRLAGHSMGGGLVVAMLQDPKLRARVHPEVTLLAPYVYRLEFYLFEQATSLGFGNFAATFNAYDRLPNLFKLAPESLLNLFSEPQMGYQFGRYYDNSLQNQKGNPDIRWRQIKAAIATVHGLKDLNTVRLVKDLPNENKFNLVLGKSDMVVERSLLMKLGRAIEQKGGQVLEVNSGHTMLQDMPDPLAETLIRFTSALPQR